MATERKSLGYGAGALAVIVVSLGVAAIVYSTNWFGLNLYNLPAWIFGPLGVYTIAYSLVSSKDSTYYLVWGTIMIAVGVVSAFYEKMSIFLVVGALLIVLAIIGIIAYWRSKK